MFELRFENQQARQKRSEGAVGARQWGHVKSIMNPGEALVHSGSQ